VDCGDFVIVTNAKKVALTGNKASQRMKQRYTKHTGGLKMTPYGEVREHHPERLIEDAVRRMMPKNRIGRHMLTKLKVYPGTDHPHAGVSPVPLAV
jgi:large subunit ribosomal protein L13